MGKMEQHKEPVMPEGPEQGGGSEALRRGGTASDDRWEGDGGRLQIGWAAQGGETQWREVAARLRWRQRLPVMHPVPCAQG